MDGMFFFGWDSQFVEFFVGFVVVCDCVVEVVVVVFVGDLWQQCFSCGLDVVDQFQVEWVLFVQLCVVDVDLDGFCVVGVELFVWEVVVQYQQCVGGFYCLIFGCEVEQVCYFDVEGVVVFDEFFVVQGVDDWCIEFVGEGDDFVVGVFDFCVGEDCDVFCCVQQCCGFFEFWIVWDYDWMCLFDYYGMVVGDVGQCDVVWDYQYCYFVFFDCCVYGDFYQVWYLFWVGDVFDVYVVFVEEFLWVCFLEVFGVDFCCGDVCGDCEYGDVGVVGVVEVVDEVQVVWIVGVGDYCEFFCGGGVGGGGECGGFFVLYVYLVDCVVFVECVCEFVQ